MGAPFDFVDPRLAVGRLRRDALLDNGPHTIWHAPGALDKRLT